MHTTTAANSGAKKPPGQNFNKLTIGVGAGNLNVRCWYFSDEPITAAYVGSLE